MRRIVSLLVVMGLIVPAFAFAGQGIIVDRSPAYWYAYAEKLPIGAMVRIRTRDGKRHTAVLAVVDRDGITVESKSRVPEPARRFPYDQIQQLELKGNNGASMAKAAAVGAAIGAGTFVTLLALLAASWD